MCINLIVLEYPLKYSWLHASLRISCCPLYYSLDRPQITRGAYIHVIEYLWLVNLWKGIHTQFFPLCMWEKIILCCSLILATPKASVGMYSGCDMLSLQILFVYFSALSTLPTSPFNFIQLFFILVFFINAIAYCPVLVSYEEGHVH